MDDVTPHVITRGGPVQFTTTHWSVVLKAGKDDSSIAREALEKLCRSYWYPLYAYVRRRGYNVEDAQDLTQEFFDRLLRNKGLADLKPEGAKFRSFLLTALNRFLTNQWTRAQAQKRGGQHPILSLDAESMEGRYQIEPVEKITPAELFEQRWALAVLEQVHERLRQEYVAIEKSDLFEHLQEFLAGNRVAVKYADIARLQGISEGAVKVAVHRLRKRYGELLRQEIAQTVASPDEVEDELHYLIQAASR
jgi:RNA polymerase sigma factor (sigma-70 family)